MDGETHLALRFLEDHPDEAAALLETRSSAEATALLSRCPPETVANVLRRCVVGFAVDYLAALSLEEATPVLARFPPHSAVSVLRTASPEWSAAIRGALAREDGDPVERLLRHAPGTAGALMDPRTSALPSDLRVAEALEQLRLHPEHSVYYLYVVDRDGHLLGVLNYRDLLLADPEAVLVSVMRASVSSVRADAQGAALRGHPGWRSLFALPVVDAEDRLLGAMRHDTVFPVATQATPAEDGGSGTRKAARAVWRWLAALTSRLRRAGGGGTKEAT
jgi:magnesium transporter